MGLGEAIARRFAEEGARVVCVDVRPGPNDAVVDAIRSDGGEALSVEGSVAAAADTRRVATVTLERFGRIDILVNNAGILPSRETVLETTEADWDETMRVNVKGVFLMSRAVLPAMIAQGGGALVNLSSITGVVGLPVRPAYSASKGAVAILTKQMAVDFGRHGDPRQRAQPVLRDHEHQPRDVRPDAGRGRPLGAAPRPAPAPPPRRAA